MPSPGNQSQFTVSPETCFLRYQPANTMQSNPQMACIRFPLYQEPYSFNNEAMYDETAKTYNASSSPYLAGVCPTLTTIAPTNVPMYNGSTNVNGFFSTANSNHQYLYNDAGLVVGNNATFPYSTIPTPLNASYYASTMVPTVPLYTTPINNFVQQLPFSQYNSNVPVIHHTDIRCDASKNSNPPPSARQWIGELQEVSEKITHYQCCFEVEVERFQALIEELKKLFRSKIDIINDMPSCGNRVHISFAYFKFADFPEFNKFCHPEDASSSSKQFSLPGKLNQSYFKVNIKALSLSSALFCNKANNNNRGNSKHEFQLYVDGLERAFVAQDLYKIYDDLYQNVTWVRVFSDKNGYPNNSALIGFRQQESYEKALNETPITVKTSIFTKCLRHKVYERSSWRGNFNNQHKASFYQSESNHALNHRNHHREAYNNYRDQNNNRNNGNINRNHNGNEMSKIFKKSSTIDSWSNMSSSSRLRRLHWEYEQNERNLRNIWQESQNGSSKRYAKVQQSLNVYKKLQYQNYLSD